MKARAGQSAVDPILRRPLRGRMWMVGAALLWSSSGLFVKAPIFAPWPPEARGLLLAFWRAVFAGVVFLPLVRRPRFDWLLIPLGACFTIMSLSYLTSMSLSTAANAIWLQYMAPWWVFLLGVMVFKERATGRDLVPLGFGLAGVGTIVGFEFFWVTRPDVIGVGCGLLSGITYALVVLLMRRLRDEDPMWLVALNQWIVVIVTLPLVLRLGVWPTAGQLGLLAVFGPFQMALPYVLMICALRTISSHEAVAIGLLEPVCVPVWVLLVWGEVPAWWTVAGAGMILTGLVLRYALLERVALGRMLPETTVPTAASIEAQTSGAESEPPARAPLRPSAEAPARQSGDGGIG